MATRHERLGQFPSEDERPPGQPFELLCEDHIGTYVLPFLCRWTGETWCGIDEEQTIDVTVVGWRRPRAPGPKSAGGQG